MPKKPRIEIKCPNCKKMFEVIETQAHKRTFCSRKCQLDGRFNPNYGNHPVAWNKGLPHSEETKRRISRATKGRRGLIGKRNPFYKRGWWVDTNGYIEQMYHGKRRKLHLIIWEKANGPIPKGYEIHHINEDKQDNRLENLQMLTKKEHMRLQNGLEVML